MRENLGQTHSLLGGGVTPSTQQPVLRMGKLIISLKYDLARHVQYICLLFLC